jgi:hypothetical protein
MWFWPVNRMSLCPSLLWLIPNLALIIQWLSRNNIIFTMMICILLRVYQIKSLDKPLFATSIARVFYFMYSFMFTTCFGPDESPSSGDIISYTIFKRKLPYYFNGSVGSILRHLSIIVIHVHNIFRSCSKTIFRWYYIIQNI